jgi:serine protease AprX
MSRRVSGPLLAALIASVGFSSVGAASATAAVDPGPAPAAGFPAATAEGHSHGRVKVVVRGTPGSTTALVRQVRARHGRVTRLLPIIDGVAATVPAGAVAALRSDPDVVSVTPDAAGHVTSVNPSLGYDPGTDTGSLDLVTQLVGARSMWSAGWTGKGVDVALIDTGVARVQGLKSGNVVNGPDLSTDSTSTALRYSDSYGHGTHMASIIAGRDALSTPAGYATDNGSTGTGKFDGVAPDARIIDIKVGATDGAADVSQVIAAIGWVAQHAHDPGLNIRVLNLSYGTSSTQDYTLDPLSYAAEAAWRKGIAVVVAAGNDGTKNTELADPAQDPAVIAVGAEDPNGTVSTLNDTIPDFSNRGTSRRHVDVVAPGTHVLGLRVPGSVVDLTNPSAAVGTRFLRGSGTSQATAVTSGVVALLLQAHPDLTPDQVKWAISTSATLLLFGTVTNRGAGMVNARSALTRANSLLLPSASSLVQNADYGTGTGSLEASRGTAHLALGSTVITTTTAIVNGVSTNTTSTTTTPTGTTLTGEKDIFGTAWNAKTWAPAALAGTAWNGGSWRGNTWTGTSFNSTGDWNAVAWNALSWDGSAWSGRTWVGRTWVADGWSGRTWVSNSWSGRTWVDQSWSSGSWS